jgi:hypothetical protein
MLEFLLTGINGPFELLFRQTDAPNESNRAILAGRATQRKLRLVACACMRRAKDFGGSDRLRAIRISEQFADGLVDQAALKEAFVQLRKLPEPIPPDADFALSVFGPTDAVHEARLIDVFSSLGPEFDVWGVAARVAEIITETEGAENLSRRGKEERGQQAHLLRDIFGNPFRPVTLDPACLNEKTRAVARAIYDNGEFGNLRRLARALKEDAACANREVQDHCEWQTRHVRGCWVVDLILGKA